MGSKDRRRRSFGRTMRLRAEAAEQARPRDPMAEAKAYRLEVRMRVAARTGGLCALCLRPVDLTIAHPDWMAPSMDHIVPKSRGGSDAESNLQLAHNGCNIKRGNPQVKAEGTTRLVWSWERGEWVEAPLDRFGKVRR